MPHLFALLSFLRRWVAIALLSLLTACSLPQVQAQDRIFLDLSLEFLDESQLSDTKFQGTPVGGLSALTYDRTGNRFYAISDDRGNLAPARFYTLNVDFEGEDSNIGLDTVEIEDVTTLKTEDGQPYVAGSIDPEGIALTAGGTVVISSEGATQDAIEPFVGEYDVATGQLQQYFPLPPYYIPDEAGELQTVGVRNNLGFEALTLNFGGTIANGEPFRVFAATESALRQDVEENLDESADATPERAKVRLLHYLVTEGRPQILAEHLYRLDPPPFLAMNGLTELVSIDGGGHFLSLERSFGARGNGAKIFQLSLGDANDIAGSETLKGNVSGVRSIRKQLLLDLGELEIDLDNLEGMTLGPRLADGSQSLLLVSDDNFSEDQVTQFLLFRLNYN
ncbi:MAG: esterase-like activity of phytase family protein [Cyanobacteriota bacterium]|nr:esterase-like activity of phytase family protein [Cyanobacteriota bacterium]